MITTKLYLDKRAVKDDADAPLKIVVSKNGSTALYSTGIKIPVRCWDAKKQKVVNHPNMGKLNIRISRIKIDFDEVVMDLQEKGELSSLSATAVKKKVAAIISPVPEEKDDTLFCNRFAIYIIRCKAKRTQDIYANTLKKIKAYDKKAASLRFEDITKAWLDGFEKHLVDIGNKTNTISIDLRNIRAVFNYAIDEEITVCYPFRRKKINSEPTKKRALPVEELRKLFASKNQYAELFKLCFLLIGINLVDLCQLEKIEDNRINYKRAKTGRPYSIKVEEEARELIARYKGTKKLLSWGEMYSDYKVLTMTADKALKAFYKGLSLYWARHSWATVAASLDIPNETIAASLGHSYGNRTTSIYIDFDTKKIDIANRKVIDWVLYGKKNTPT